MNSKIKPLYTTFLLGIKLCGYKLGIEFNKHVLAVEKFTYSSKVVNVYIVYDLYACEKFRLEILQ